MTWTSIDGQRSQESETAKRPTTDVASRLHKKGVHPCFLFGIYFTGNHGESVGAAPYFLSASSDIKIRNPDLNLATMHLQRGGLPDGIVHS